MIPARRLAGVLAAAALLAGCSGPAGKPAPRTSPPFAGCAGLTSAPARASTASAPARGSAAAAGIPAGSAGAGEPLPDLALPCFTGGQTVDIGHIRGPALINLWASWCPPCLEELPVFQRLAGRVEGQLHVIGVVSNDERGRAESLADELGLTFPTVYDRPADLLRRVGGAGLPATVFVGARGRISYVYNSTPLDDTTLARLVKQHLGVVVPA